MLTRFCAPSFRAALVAAVVAALVLAQGLGLLHRIGHASRGAPAATGAAWSQAMQLSPDDPAGRWAQALFGGHQRDVDCQSYDQLTHADALRCAPTAVPALDLPSSQVIVHRAWNLAAQSAGYLARGPPGPN